MLRALSLRTQLLISHTLVTVVGIALVAIFAGNTLTNAPISESEQSLEDVGFVISKQLEEPLKDYLEDNKNRDRATIQTLLAQYATRDQIELAIITYKGEVISLTANPSNGLSDPSQTVEVRDTLLRNDKHDIRVDNTGREMLYAGLQIEHEDKVYGVLRLGRTLAPVREAQGRIILNLILVVFSAGVIVSLVVWFLANYLTLPLQQLTYAAQQLAEGQLSVSVPHHATNELAQLTLAFNEMAERLQALLEDQRAFVANASHELRTPLTGIKLRIEALRKGAYQDPAVGPKFMAEVENEIDRLSQMVNDLLALSRIESQTERHENVDLVQMAEEARDAFSVRATRVGVKVEVVIKGTPPHVSGDESQLRRLIDNLLDNAIKYTPSGGGVTIQIKETNGDVKLIVQDSGVGIPAEELPKVFDRFYRGDSPPLHTLPRESSGLGLSIAHSIVRAHGGDIIAESEIGKGTTITVLFKIKTSEA